MSDVQYYSIACVCCRASHRKCDRVLPSCGQCKKRNAQCIYEPSKKRTRQQSSSAVSTIPTKQPRMESQQHVIVTGNQFHPISPSSSSNSSSSSSSPSPPTIVLPQTIQGLPMSLMNPSSTIASSEILDICFQLYSTREMGDEFEQSIIAQFLWNRAIPHPMQLTPEQIEIRVNQALWFSIQAVSLQNLPSFNDSDRTPPNVESSKELQIFSQFQSKLLQQTGVSNSLVKMGSDVTLMADRLKRFSREQLRQTAEQMFTAAKDMLLDPLLYSHIASNYRLAQAITYLVSYLLVQGERIEDAQLLLSAEQVYLDRASHILDADLSGYHGAIRDRLEEQQRITKILTMAHSSMKSMVWFNFTPKNRDYYTLKRFKKFIKLLIESMDISNFRIPSIEIVEYMTIQKELMKRLKQTIKDKDGDDTIMWINKVLEIVRQMQESLRPDPEYNFLLFWRIFVYSFQFFAVDVAIGLTPAHDKSTHAVLKQFQIEIANSISRETYQYSHVSRLAGARFTGLLSFAARTHVEQSTDICGSKSPSSDPLFMEVLSFMQMDSMVLDSVINKHNIKSFVDLNTRVKQQIEFHKSYCDQQTLEKCTLITANAADTFSADADFNNTVESFFDHLYDSLQSDVGASHSPDDTKFVMNLLNMSNGESNQRFEGL
jgi:hypothetical protein